jgi:hypothetical protein
MRIRFMIERNPDVAPDQAATHCNADLWNVLPGLIPNGSSGIVVSDAGEIP